MMRIKIIKNNEVIGVAKYLKLYKINLKSFYLKKINTLFLLIKKTLHFN